MKKFKVILTGSLLYSEIFANDEDGAYKVAMKMAESCRVDDMLTDAEVKEVTE